ncbi:MAG: ATP-binding protein [Dermabacter sp.]|nr:ATP-binding protein [Dermabacter sp.]
MTEVIQPSARLWVRPRGEAVLVGVCAAVGRATGVPTVLMRTLFLLGGMSFLTGALGLLTLFPLSAALTGVPLVLVALGGVSASSMIVYLIAWASLPSDAGEQRVMLSEGAASRVRGRPSLQAGMSAAQRVLTSRRTAGAQWLVLSGIIGASVTMIVLGILALVAPWWETGTRLGVGAGIVATGAGIGLLPLGLVDDARWSGTVGTLPRAVAYTLAVSVTLLLGGSLIMVESVFGVEAMAVTGSIALIVLGLMSVVLIPWGRRLWRGMREESEQRALVHQQAEITAHLHDSVLQTLTVIQREGVDPDRMRQLARQQEVELRRWLYGKRALGSTAGPGIQELPASLREAVTLIAEQVEKQHGVEIDVVAIGDCEMSEEILPLALALREAASNAVRHGKSGVRVFLDAADSPIELFVRDRGPGFAVTDIPEGRLGVRESIIGRMERAGGSARIGPAIGGGAEVTLAIDRPPGNARGS